MEVEELDLPDYPEEVYYDFEAYIHVILGQDLEDYALKVLDAIEAGYKKIGIRACHMVGKTHLIGCLINAIIALWKQTKVIATAPTFDQVRLNVFGEIHKQFKNTPIEFQKGRLNQTEWNVDETHWVVGKSVQKSAGGGGGEQKSSKLQGFHADQGRVIVIIDEAVGVEEQIFTQVEGITSGDNDMVIMTYNPTSKNCAAYKKVNSDEYIEIVITCFDSPNFIHYGIKNLEQLLTIYDEWQAKETKEEKIKYLEYFNAIQPRCISIKWVLNRLKEWGVKHPLFRSKCLGEWPDEDSNVLFPESVIIAAMKREYQPVDEDFLFIGVDIAREGADDTVFTELVGKFPDPTILNGDSEPTLQQVRPPFVENNLLTNEVVDHFINWLEASPYRWTTDRMGKPMRRRVRVAIDRGNTGGGVIDYLRLAQQKGMEELENVEILLVNFGGSDWTKIPYGTAYQKAFLPDLPSKNDEIQEDRENYTNYKAAMFDLLRFDLWDEICLYNGEETQVYIETMPTIKALYDKGTAGKMHIQSKLEYKAETGLGSPDEADSLALANFARYFALV